ncbi:DUF2799 domain-containing protein [Spartinivicinus poritis]|uniref:DUF2799 domain-containing protein n=1 Tax=Spartinivicinus poritis TaxID=2994640 RepID=A0ABT5U4T8_9GAMM|nr:DUF2799 domain-containing protein [Spartinivicinus sp. A2-2]MDE1461373.1 DUF2799 domain-containing protein [Spartinivicinus sp. A2-2]
MVVRIATKITPLWRWALIGLAIVGLNGCATLSREECLSANWQTIGYEDGTKGRLPGFVAEHRKACAEYGVVPDLTSYQQGREEGVRHYCRPANGYYLGRHGYSYSGVCSEEEEAEFLRAWHQGERAYRTEQRIRELEREIWQLRENVERLKHEKSTKIPPPSCRLVKPYALGIVIQS